MTTTAAVEKSKVYELAQELLDVYRAAHNRWAANRAAEGEVGIAELFAIHITLRVLTRSFPLDGPAVEVGPETIAALNAMADAFEVTTGPVPDVQPGYKS